MKTYLFDFDGTLVDSMPYYGAAMLRILDENRISYGSDILKIITPLGTGGTADYFIQMGLNKTKEEIIYQMGVYLLDAYTYHIPAKANVISTLKALKASGASLNVLTASPHLTMDPCLKRLGMYELFDNVWSCDDFKTTKADPQIYVMAAQRLGKSRSAVANLLRMLNLPKEVAQMVIAGEISEGHARAILGAEEPEKMIALANKVVDNSLNVRQTETLVKAMKEEKSEKEMPAARCAELSLVEEAARMRFGTKVTVTGNEKRGRIILHYGSLEDLERIYEFLKIKE